MANKRIKDLSTTAAVTASDDFIAVDGATNGTRKLNAYSPTFGGNLTVSGNVYGGSNLVLYGTTGATGNVYLRAQGIGYVRVDTGSGFRVESGSLDVTAGNLTVSGTGNSSVLGNLAIGQSTNAANARLNVLGANNAGLRIDQGSYNYHAAFEHVFSSLSYTTEYARITSTGNLLLGTTTDGGQKLQVNGTAAISGALSIGNTVQTAVSVASTHKVTISIGGSTYYLLATNV